MLKKINSKWYLFGLIISGILFLGGSIYRAIISYTLFEPFSLIVRNDITYETLKQTLILIGNVNVYILISYPILLFFLIVFIVSSKISLKVNGWLFMIVILFGLFLPVEIYVGYLDLKLSTLVLFTDFNTNLALSLLIARIGALGGLPAIAFLCYITAIWLAIFQPLKKKAYENSGERISVTA